MHILKNTSTGFIFAGVFSLFINALFLSGPLYMLLVYDRALTSGSVSTLVGFSILLGLLFLAMGILTLIRSRLLIRIGNRIGLEQQARVFDAQLRPSLGQPSTEGIRELNVLREFFSSQTPALLFDAPWVPIFIFIAWVLHPVLGLVAVGGTIALLVLGIISDIVSRRGFTSANRANQASRESLDNIVKNYEVVRAMAMQSILRSRWSLLQNRAYEHQARSAEKVAAYSAASKTIRMGLQSAVLGIGVYLAILEEISPGAIIAASVIVARALAPTEQLIASWQQCVNALGAYVHLRRILQVAQPKPKPVTLPEPKGEVRASNLFVSAPGQRQHILKGVSFSMTSGDTLAVIGPSGSGKSTLVRAMLGIWAPTSGEVSLDGAMMQQWPDHQLCRAIGYLPQSISWIDGTIRDNICRFDPEATDEDVTEAAQIAGVHDLIASLPDGYLTRLGKDGVQMSGGEAQRIALARAVFGRPAFIVLDEPNANLDQVGEDALQRTISTLRARKQSVLIVAHRPHTIVLANKVLVLQDGRVSNFGPREAVLGDNGTIVQMAKRVGSASENVR